MLSDIKKLFKSLQKGSKSLLFTEDQTNKKMLKKLKKSKYDKDKEFVNLFNLLENNDEFQKKPSVPIKASFVEKLDDNDKSTLYSFDGPFQLLHADVKNLKLRGKPATDPKYSLLFVDLFS